MNSYVLGGDAINCIYVALNQTDREPDAAPTGLLTFSVTSTDRNES